MTIFLSTGRTGTKYLTELLGQLPQKCEVEHQRRGSRRVNIQGNLISHYPSLMRVPGFKANIEIISNKLILDPLQSMVYYEHFRQNGIDPGIKIIHVVRDPRDFVSSFMNWKLISFKRTMLHHVVPLWQPNPWLAGEMSFSRWLLLSKFEHFCWIWSYKNKLFSEFSESPDYLLVKFEDLIKPDSNNATWPQLCQFIGLSNNDINAVSSQSIPKAQKSKFPSWSEWSPTQAVKLHKYCGDLMIRYNYGNETEWKSMLGDITET